MAFSYISTRKEECHFVQPWGWLFLFHNEEVFYVVDDKKNIPDVKKVEILQAGKRREANPDPRHGRSYPCWKGGGFYCSQGWPRNGEVYEETVSDEGLTNEDILDHDNLDDSDTFV